MGVQRLRIDDFLPSGLDESTGCKDSPARLTQFEQLRIATDVIKQEADALSQLAAHLPDDFCVAVELLQNCRGAVIVTGVGKAGWIGQKISASLASTGTRSHYLHPAEALHGDLGRVAAEDVILVFSNSGETSEILKLIPTFENLGTPIISITGKTQSTLAAHSAVLLNYGTTQEACHLGLAPSTSTAMMLALGDALALVTSQAKGFQAIDFAKFHPGGSLGKRLSLVEDVMRPISECRVAQESETVREIYIQHGGRDRRAGVVLIVNETGRLTGIFTDSDLAKLLERQQDNFFDCPIASVMTRSPISIPAGSRTMVAIEKLASRSLSELPVVDRNGQAIGLIDITDVVNIPAK
ncbi:MAG: arabinose-5-phosphate isomerase [Mariniblastus sp.]|jgi:arabinose-5-phosphate isomerase